MFFGFVVIALADNHPTFRSCKTLRCTNGFLSDVQVEPCRVCGRIFRVYDSWLLLKANRLGHKQGKRWYPAQTFPTRPNRYVSTRRSGAAVLPALVPCSRGTMLT